jgi:hypothetical protein
VSFYRELWKLFATKPQTTPEESFDEFFSNEGGLADMSGHPGETIFAERRRSYQKFLRDRAADLAKQGTIIDVHFDFIDSPDINAAAGKAGELYLIGVNFGTLETLMSVPNALLSWPEILPQIGDASKEQPEVFDLAGAVGVTYQPRSDRVSNNGRRTLLPRDKMRQFAAICMTLMGIDFVVAHELGHIMAGHVDFLGSQGLALRLNEHSPTATPLSVPLLQAIELEADLDAGFMLASAVLERFIIGNDFAEMFDEQTFLTLWVFTVLMLFHLFDLAGSSVETYQQKEHPHPEHRLLFVLTALLANTEMTNPKMGTLVENARAAGLEELDRAWSLLGLAESARQAERRNTAAFLDEGTRLSESYSSTLEPVRQFAVAHNLGMTFGFPVDIKRPLRPPQGEQGVQ